jgi:hypothetical protein
MHAEQKRMTWLYYAIMCLVAIAPLILLGLYARSKFDALFKRYVLSYVLSNMSEDDKKKIYAQFVAQSPGIYEAIPEPLVGRLLQQNIRNEHYRAEVVSNNAGMRSTRPYERKRPDRYRILCLGDSVVFGMAGREEDRLGDQIQEILRALGTKVNGKEIEVYSIGVPGWTTLNEATYLSSRLSDYDPDLVLVVMFPNDITDSIGVSGTGQMTFAFSPECRTDGSGVFANVWPSRFGVVTSGNLLQDDLGPESRSRWEKAFASWKRLEDLLNENGKKMILGLIDWDPLFTELSKAFYERSKMTSPFILTNNFENALPHDYHPDRAGHRIIALHYLHTLARLGWLPLNADSLEPLDSRLNAAITHPPSPEKIRALKSEKIAKFLDEEIDFDRMSERNVMAILGGIYPYKMPGDSKVRCSGSLKSGFLLKRNESASRVVIEIEVPSYVELYPFKLEATLDGSRVVELILDSQHSGGRHQLKANMPKPHGKESAVEIVLRTDSYWTTIDDPVMRSYVLISARQE